MFCSKKSLVAAVIPAAGSARRMKGADKLFLELEGVPVIIRTLRVFEAHPQIEEIIIPTREDAIETLKNLCREYGITKAKKIICGGETRAHSVLNGIRAVDKKCGYVAIHDGARPFVQTATISEVANALADFDAALCVSKINDTVKKVSENGDVIATVDRSMLYAAQTPQGVDVTKYKEACKTLTNVDELTDDVSVMEAAGYSVKAVVGSAKNIKITTPDDIAIAEALVKGESET